MNKLKSYTIRKATKSDMPQVLELIKELAVFEREPMAVEVTVEELQADGFGENPAFTCIVAEKNGSIDGTALIYYRYSTWKGKAIHLEDLIVKESCRGLGIGSALLDEVIKYGHQNKVRRISWEVLDWNTPAIEFYNKKGATILKDWYLVQLDTNGIKNYMKNLKDENI